jgi:DNA-binding NarL/FixJ family response regulator
MTTVGAHTVSPPFMAQVERRTASDHHAKSMSIVLIDRRPLMRQCLSLTLKQSLPNLRMVSAGSTAELVDLAGSLEGLHLIVFNIGDAPVRNSDVLGQITWLRQHLPHVPLVLLIDRDDINDIIEAMAHGVRGFITTSMELLETAAVIQCVAAGGTFVPASALVKFALKQPNGARGTAGEGNVVPFESLTPRESEVLAHLGQGKPNQVIAQELEIRESTVKVFVRRILSKLLASNRTELALLARGWSAGAESNGSDQH